MTDVKTLILKRFPKYVMGNLTGTLVDTVVLWLFSHFVFSSYVGQVIVSPVISFECAVLTNFVVCCLFTWKDRIAKRSKKGHLRRYLIYNASCIGGFLIKMAMLMLIQYLTKWDVVVCNLLALVVSGLFNFSMAEFVIFKKKKTV